MWWKKILVPFVWSFSNLAVNGSANFIMMKRCGLTFNDFDTMSYEALLAIFNKDVYANFCIQAYTYTALAFIEMMILLFIKRKKVKSLEIFLIDLFVFILVAVSNISMYFMGNSKFMPVTGIVSFFALIFIMVYSYSRLRFYQEYSKTEAENKFLKEKEINLMAWNSNDAEFFKEAWKKNTSNTEIDKKVEVLLNYLCNCQRIYLEKQDMVIKKSKMLPK